MGTLNIVNVVNIKNRFYLGGVMSWDGFTISKPIVGTDGSFLESKSVISGVNRNSPAYIKRSLGRLCLMGDVPYTCSKQVICRLIQEYGACLAPEQRKALERWCS
jgi:hypothetical protein